MADFASMMGGGPSTVPTAAADPNAAFFYSFDEGDVFLDLGAQGDQFFGVGNVGSATVLGGTGDDTLAGGLGDDLFGGGTGDDSFAGGAGADTIDGRIGNDAAAGEAGNDSLTGWAGDDVLDGGLDDDEIEGGSGDDTLLGGAGDDTIFGVTGSDSIDGGEGDDALYGGAGDDSLVGGAGDDTLAGGPGSDGFYYFDGFGDDVISDLRDGDSIYLQANINGTGVTNAADLLTDPGVSVSGGAEAGVNFTLISIGGDTIRLQNVNVDDFTSNISSFVKIA